MKEEELKISQEEHRDNSQHDSQEGHREKHHKKRHHHHKKHENHTREEGHQESKKIENVLGSSSSVRVIEVQVKSKE